MQAWQITFHFKAFSVLLISLIVIAGSLWFYWRIKGSIPSRDWGLLVGLRMLGLGILLVLIFQPALGFKAGLVKESVLAVVVDGSRSMGVEDLSGQSRLETVKGLLRENLDILGRTPAARIFSFSNKPAPIELGKIDGLKAEGQTTDISNAIGSLNSYIPAENIQAVILLSDGNHLGPENPAEAVKALLRPVYCLGTGSSDTSVGASRVGIEGVEFPVKMAARAQNVVTAQVSWQGVKKGESALTLTATVDGKRGLEKTISVTTPSGRREVEISVRPEGVGKTVCTFELSRRTDQGREIHAAALPEKLRILMVEGQVRPEYKFLKQYLQSDPAAALAAFVQIRPGKFLVTNQIPDYHPTGLPASRAEFEKFDLIILGDISARTFTAQQAGWVKEVIEKGSGLLFLAGENTGNLRETVFTDLLPVRLKSKTTWLEEPFLPRLTPAGRINPALKDLAPLAEKEGKLAGLFSAGPALPAATVLLEGPNGNPVLALRPVGKGKSAILTAESTWRWALNPNPILRQRLYQTFWGGLARELANKNLTGKLKPVLIVNTDTNAVQTGKTVQIRADFFDDTGKTKTTSPMTAELLKNSRPVESVSLTPVQDHYEGRLTVKEPGDYKLQVRGDGLEDMIGLTAYALDQELLQVRLNKKLLDEMARAGGTEKMISPGNFGQILRDLREQFAARSEKETNLNEFRSFDYRVFLLILFIGAISTEWVLRYRWRLR